MPVTVVDVEPAVTLTSPAASAVVSGTAVAIKATSTAARTQAHRLPAVPEPAGRQREALHRRPAPGRSHTCTATLRWNASKSVGAAPHARHDRDDTRSSTGCIAGPHRSTPRPRAGCVLTTPAIVRAGATVTLRGTVIATTSGHRLRGVRVTSRDAPRSAARPPSASPPAPAGCSRSPTSRAATPSVRSSPAHDVARGVLGVDRLRASAPMSCSVANRSLRVGAVGKGSCFVPGLPVGTGLSLRYIVNGRDLDARLGPVEEHHDPVLVRLPAARASTTCASTSWPTRSTSPRAAP